MRLRRVLLLGVAALLTLSAALAIAILLFGDFGETEGRILGTTAVLAGHGVLAVPAAVLLDRDRARPLALILVVAALASVAAWMVLIWVDPGSDSLWRTVGTASAVLVAVSQAAAMTARARPADPPAVRALFAASCVLAGALAGVLVWLIWADPDAGPAVGRVVAALAVADVGAVALQPLLARAAAAPLRVRLRITLRGGEVREREERGGDLAAAVAAAIRALEGGGERVDGVEVVERTEGPARGATGATGGGS